MSVFRTIPLFTFLAASILLTPACALLKKPTPLTQLQLVLNPEVLNWPAQLELGNIKARGVLQTDRVIVTNGALVMQHAGLRWVAAPATLLAEQLAIARVATIAAPGKHPGRASIDVWITDFNIAVNTHGETSVAVAAWASVRCPNARSASQVPVIAFALPLNANDPQRIAARFAAATTLLIKALLVKSAEKSAQC